MKIATDQTHIDNLYAPSQLPVYSEMIPFALRERLLNNLELLLQKQGWTELSMNITILCLFAPQTKRVIMNSYPHILADLFTSLLDENFERNIVKEYAVLHRLIALSLLVERSEEQEIITLANKWMPAIRRSASNSILQDGTYQIAANWAALSKILYRNFTAPKMFTSGRMLNFVNEIAPFRDSFRRTPTSRMHWSSYIRTLESMRILWPSEFEFRYGSDMPAIEAMAQQYFESESIASKPSGLGFIELQTILQAIIVTAPDMGWLESTNESQPLGDDQLSPLLQF